MSTEPSESTAPPDPGTDDLARLRAYLNSSDWQARVQEAARQRARVRAEGGPSRVALSRMQRARSARDQALTMRTPTAPAAARTEADPVPPNSAPLTDRAQPVAKKASANGSIVLVAAGVLRSLGGWFAGIAAGLAACLLAGVVGYAVLGLRTDPRPAAIVAPDATQHLTGIQWMVERGAASPPRIPAPRSPGGALPAGRDVAATAETANLPQAPLPEEAGRPPSLSPRVIAMRSLTQSPTLPTHPFVAETDHSELRLASAARPVPVWRPAPVRHAAEPAPVVDAGVSRPVTAQFRAGFAEPSATGGSAAVVDYATAPPDFPTGRIEVSAAVPEPVAPDVAPTIGTDMSVPTSPFPMAAVESRRDPPRAIVLAVLTIPDRMEPRGMTSAAVAPDPPRVDTEIPAGWTGPVTTIQRPLRAILTQSGTDAGDVEHLGRLGVAVAKVQITRFAVPMTRVHYFHGEDASPARNLAAVLGGEAIDLTGFAPSPPPGTLEIQMAE